MGAIGLQARIIAVRSAEIIGEANIADPFAIRSLGVGNMFPTILAIRTIAEVAECHLGS
jgi:hypothetical protein